MVLPEHKLAQEDNVVAVAATEVDTAVPGGSHEERLVCCLEGTKEKGNN